MATPAVRCSRWHSLHGVLSSLLACTLALIVGNSMAATTKPSSVPEAVRQQFKLAPFYQKYLDAGGLPIVGSDKVSDNAMAECAWIVGHMLERRPDILEALGKAGVRFAVMAHNEYTTDIPEHSTLEPKVYWDRRARGLGATRERPAVSCAEENLLAFPGDPYPTENIGIHEFAHAIHEMGLRELDPDFDAQLRKAYESAKERGLWKGTYAAVNHMEYWAEAVQSWFDNNRENDALHNHVNTRVELMAYDPAVAELCERVFGDIAWRYQKPADRPAEGRAHFSSYDPANAPRFQWRNVPVPEQPRIMLQCAEGELELELDGTVPPENIAAFLDAVHLGYYSDGLLQCGADRLRLTPATQLPGGDAVPPNQGQYVISFGNQEAAAAPDGSLRARLTKGDVLLRKLTGTSEWDSPKRAVRIQRIVRLN